MKLNFVKMNGAGNDFVIFDARKTSLSLSQKQVKKVADRANDTTKGCDQVIAMEPSKKADVFMRIHNADGGEIDACGNATRCVAWLVARETSKKHIVIETNAGLLDCRFEGSGRIRVDMGEPRLDWQQIPLLHVCDTLHLPIEVKGLSDPVAVSMGNPHMVFVVPDADAAPVETKGRELEHHPLYPERANVSFAEKVSDRDIKLRVWERGAGETLACGTAACAALVALARRDLVGREATIHLPGGDLEVAWDKNNHVFMTGPVEMEGEGTIKL